MGESPPVVLDRALDQAGGAPRILVTDALAQGVAASDVERTVEVSHTLTTPAPAARFLTF